MGGDGGDAGAREESAILALLSPLEIHHASPASGVDGPAKSRNPLNSNALSLVIRVGDIDATWRPVSGKDGGMTSFSLRERYRKAARCHVVRHWRGRA